MFEPMVNKRKQDSRMIWMGTGGQITLPAKLRKELTIKEGDSLVVSVHEGTIHLTPSRVMLEKAQAVVRSHNSSGIVLSEVLLEARWKKNRRKRD
jgi:AbrB family looped-hinge helix DNA binding protein